MEEVWGSSTPVMRPPPVALATRPVPPVMAKVPSRSTGAPLSPLPSIVIVICMFDRCLPCSVNATSAPPLEGVETFNRPVNAPSREARPAADAMKPLSFPELGIPISDAVTFAWNGTFAWLTASACTKGCAIEMVLGVWRRSRNSN